MNSLTDEDFCIHDRDISKDYCPLCEQEEIRQTCECGIGNAEQVGNVYQCADCERMWGWDEAGNRVILDPYEEEE